MTVIAMTMLTPKVDAPPPPSPQPPTILVTELFDFWFFAAMATNNCNQRRHCKVDPIFDEIFFPYLLSCH
jgi:hypothetical protein